jgi:hypothetical protein
MNSFWNDVVLGWKGSFFNLPHKIMMFCNQAFIFENFFLEKNNSPCIYAIKPLDLTVIYKIVLGFNFFQFNP